MSAIRQTPTEDYCEVLIKTEATSDTEEILPELLVTVEVEEANDAQELDFSALESKKDIPTKKKESHKPRRRKKYYERPEAREERLERDRVRKSWARQNETAEQRKARLEYHRKYKRRSRAKAKEGQETPQNPDPAYDPLAETDMIEIKLEPLDTDNETVDSNDTNHLSREDLAYTVQCAIVSKMYKGRRINDICKLYNTTPDIVNEIWEDREQFDVQKPGHKAFKHLNGKVEKSVLEWIKQQTDYEVQLTGRMIQNAAEGFAKDLGFVSFDGSRKWLDRFKKKNNIMFKTRKRDYSATPDYKCRTQFFVEQWAEAREGLTDDDIYIADEVGLFYNPSKNRIQKLRGRKFVQGCIKDRLSIFLCTNASGTDKKKLLVCGTEDPLQHSNRDPQTLPVLYVRHVQARFTTRIFEDYVIYWNKELEQCNKKALLVLDRASIHTKLQLTNLKLLFVPYKTKNSLVPIRNGIFARFRDEFRRLILIDKVMNCMSGVDRHLTCLEALSMLEKAWERVPPQIITASLYSIGYDVSMPDSLSMIAPLEGENNEEWMCDILKNYNIEHYFTDLSVLNEYLTVDDDLLTGQGTNPSVFGGNHKASPVDEADEHLPIGTERPECDDMEVTAKKARALQDLDIVKKFLQSKDTPFGPYCALMEVEKFITPLQ